MLAHAIRRLGLSLLILVLSIASMDGVVLLVPGSPASRVLGPRATPQLKQALRLRMGLDQPILTQIRLFFCNVLQGDLATDVW